MTNPQFIFAIIALLLPSTFEEPIPLHSIDLSNLASHDYSSYEDEAQRQYHFGRLRELMGRLGALSDESGSDSGRFGDLGSNLFKETIELHRRRNSYHTKPLASKMLEGDRKANNVKDASNSEIKVGKKRCDDCLILMDILLKQLQMFAVPDLKELVIQFCAANRIEKEDVCAGSVYEYGDSLLYVIAHTIISPMQICSGIYGYGSEGCGGEPYETHPKWNVSIPARPKPPLKPYVQPAPNAPQAKILVLSDIHLDLWYKIGSNAVCGRPACCNAVDGVAAGESDFAGFWGDYRNCDLPVWTLEKMLEDIKSKHQFDFVYFLGDLPTHHVWNQTQTDQLAVYDKLVETINRYFPKILMFPTLGNHESAPCDLFTPHSVPQHMWTANWLYRYLASQQNWPNWLHADPLRPDPKLLHDITYYGSYSVLVRPGFRVISMNRNFCQSGMAGNIWVMLNEIDPDGLLEWLVNELQTAEDNGELVHIIGHIPPDGCYEEYGRNYRNIVNRYESTIRAQFFGHTHWDEFRIFYSDDETGASRPTNVAHVFPSATPYPNSNSAFSIVTLDGFYKGTSFSLLNKEVYVLDLERANTLNITTWDKEYSYVDNYNMENMFPQAMNTLTQRLQAQPSLFATFYRHISKGSPYWPECSTDACRLTHVCTLRTTVEKDSSACASLIAASKAEEKALSGGSSQGKRVPAEAQGPKKERSLASSIKGSSGLL